jgi:hypothetical protein
VREGCEEARQREASLKQLLLPPLSKSVVHLISLEDPEGHGPQHCKRFLCNATSLSVEFQRTLAVSVMVLLLYCGSPVIHVASVSSAIGKDNLEEGSRGKTVPINGTSMSLQTSLFGADD